MTTPKTLRDEFAMAALTGIIAASENCGPDDIPIVAKVAYQFADAMLKAREGKP